MFGVLLEEDLALDSHRRIYHRMLDLFTTGRPIDELSLVEELSSHRELDWVGGVAYLADLVTGAVPVQAHVQYHISVIRRKAKLRRIVATAQQLETAAMEPGADPIQIVGSFEERLVRIREELTGIPREESGPAIESQAIRLESHDQGKGTG
jgi:replicative DNA helicase